ncbi:MAG TPA: glycogen debranching enzyme N-terminal domain-containing protein, partial [Bacteroidota bacterium]
MNDIMRRMPWSPDRNIEELLDREWLVTNGLGGYASCSIAGVVTRRYHGLLVASLPAPFARLLMFNHLEERVQVSGGPAVQIGGEERAFRDLEIHGVEHLTEFLLEDGIPTWRFNLDNVLVQKRILMPYGQNTVHVNYRVVSGNSPVHLELRPSFHFRPHGASVGEPLKHPYQMNVVGDHIEIAEEPDHPALRLYLAGDRGTLTLDGGRIREVFYRIEADRGYESRGQLWSPGYFSAELNTDHDATLIASTEGWRTVLALSPRDAYEAARERARRLVEVAMPAAREGLGQQLTLAADQFIITPAGRMEHEARAKAAGGQVFTVIAGYPWFTDWGRDTMISLEGLTLLTGRSAEAGWILRLFADYIRDGLIPNLFPEGASEGLYNTADATLWFFHSLDRYLELTHDEATLRLILPKLLDAVDWHLRGTRFGIGVDSADGLLRQGAEGYQLTWM